MKVATLFYAACLFATTAVAHPGHGSAPASDGGKPHVHFGAPVKSQGKIGQIPSSDKRKREATATPTADKALRRER